VTGGGAAIRAIIDGYDLAAERGRYAFPDVEIEGIRLNRGTAKIALRGDPDDALADAARSGQRAHTFTTTHGDGAPVLELGYPLAGHYVASHAGVHMDLYLGVGQKLLDENHPNLLRAVDRLRDLRLALRREILTDDYFAARPNVDGVVTTAMLADLLAKIANDAFPRREGYRVFFANSGTEANEAAIKLAQRVRTLRLVEKHGAPVLARLMQQLGIGTVPYFGGAEPLYADYPFFLIACEGSFHGRTLGSLHLTRSKKVHHVGYSKFRWTRHLQFNGPPDSLERILDPRPLPEILDQPGGVPAVLDKGLVPAELVALFCVEGFQGEGGYRLADRAFVAGVRETCSRHGILYAADEVQTFGRTGETFVHQHLGIVPDILTLAKGAWIGAMIARADLESYLESGWHSNTWGGGKVFDNTISYATLKTLTEHADPLFEGRGYLENERIKGEYLRERLAVLTEAHPQVLTGFSGLGCMFGLTVRRRDQLIPKAWKRGLKLLGAGPAGDESRVRLLFLADVLTKEIDDFVDAFGRVLADL
jgi:4-aminobutyrate aminotransferase-like enzyme